MGGLKPSIKDPNRTKRELLLPDCLELRHQSSPVLGLGWKHWLFLDLELTLLALLDFRS